MNSVIPGASKRDTVGGELLMGRGPKRELEEEEGRKKAEKGVGGGS